MLDEETDFLDEDNPAAFEQVDEGIEDHQADTRAMSKRSRASEQHYAEDRDYLEVLRHMQQGQWDRVVPMLRALQLRYPEAHELHALLQEADFRANLEVNWADKVKGVQSIQLPIKSLLPVIPIVLIAALLISGVLYYGQARRVTALSDQQQKLLSQAQSALRAGQHREALDLFEVVLDGHPTSEEALRGQAETRRQMQLANDYQLALDRMAIGNNPQALELLIALQRQAPGYRDVATLIEMLDVETGAPELFDKAEFAFSNNLWLSAVAQYEQLRDLDSEYESDLVEERLATAYIRVGQQIVSLRPSDSSILERAKEYFGKSMQINPANTTAKKESNILEAFLSAENMVQQANYEQGTQALEPIYAERPDYFGGYVAELLFRAYIGVGERAVQQSDLERAKQAYERALALGFDTNGAAQQRLTEINALLAPPPAAAVAAPVVNSAPVEPVAPPPPADPLDPYRGWIAFRTNRNGGEIFYLMRPDGSEQQPAPLELVQRLSELYQAQQWSPDGQQFVYVQHVSEQASTNIFKVRSDLPETWDRDIMLTDYLGTEYDPVWAPDGQSIAFVSNHTGNDEIWVMDAEGKNQRQLTANEWQWDKHPSFSPDGQQITFYSNSSGTRQVWVMNSDGGQQRNISSNEYDDWDPVWIY